MDSLEGSVLQMLCPSGMSSACPGQSRLSWRCWPSPHVETQVPYQNTLEITAFELFELHPDPPTYIFWVPKEGFFPSILCDISEVLSWDFKTLFFCLDFGFQQGSRCAIPTVIPQEGKHTELLGEAQLHDDVFLTTVQSC